MSKYTEERLFEIRDQAHVPQPQVLEAFNKLVEQVKEHTAAEHERFKNSKWSNGDTYIDEHGNERPYHHMNRRRLSKTGTKPNIRKKVAETVKVDEDGWATLTKQKKGSGAEEVFEEITSKSKDSSKELPTGIKAKPNNKNLGSSKAVDSRDAIADKQTISFNAFEALGDEEEDDDDDE